MNCITDISLPFFIVWCNNVNLDADNKGISKLLSLVVTLSNTQCKKTLKGDMILPESNSTFACVWSVFCLLFASGLYMTNHTTFILLIISLLLCTLLKEPVLVMHNIKWDTEHHDTMQSGAIGSSISTLDHFGANPFKGKLNINHAELTKSFHKM